MLNSAVICTRKNVAVLTCAIIINFFVAIYNLVYSFLICYGIYSYAVISLRVSKTLLMRFL